MHTTFRKECRTMAPIYRTVLFFVLLILLASLIQPAAARDVRIALHEIRPSLYTDENGEPAGFMVDLVKDIAAQNGWNIIWAHGTYRENLDRLAAGDIDLVLGIANTPERAKIYDFSSEPVLSSWTQVYARPGSGIQTILDLDKKRVAVLKGDSNNAAFRNYAAQFNVHPEYIEENDVDAVFNSVKNGSADAVVALWMPSLKNNNAYGLSSTPVMFSPVTLVCAVPKGTNADLLSYIDTYLARQKNDPTSSYSQIMQKWFGEKAGWVIPSWAIGALIIAVSLVCLFVIMSVVLRREVRKKTAALSRQNEELESEVKSRMKAEDALTRKNDELQSAYEELMATEEELRENYQNLRKSEQDLLQARKKLALLNSLTIRDLRNRIFSLSGYLQLAGTADGCSGKTDELLTRALDILKNVEKSLDYAKKYQDLGIGRPRWQNVNHTLLTAVSHLDSLAVTRTIELGDLEIYADPLLEDVFFTLMESLTSPDSAATAADIRYRRNADGSITILVTDNGAGIPAADKEAIFTWEYRSTAGNGLFLAREVLAITGITIAESGEPGHGARFEITVPEGVYRFGQI